MQKVSLLILAFFLLALPHSYAEKICIKKKVKSNGKIQIKTVSEGKCPKKFIELIDTSTLIGAGSVGPKGDRGAIGPQGPKGDRGPRGEPGAGATGWSDMGAMNTVDINAYLPESCDYRLRLERNEIDENGAYFNYYFDLDPVRVNRGPILENGSREFISILWHAGIRGEHELIALSALPEVFRVVDCASSEDCAQEFQDIRSSEFYKDTEYFLDVRPGRILLKSIDNRIGPFNETQVPPRTFPLKLGKFHIEENCFIEQ